MDDYLSGEGMARLEKAVHLETRRCMAEKGFDYSLPSAAKSSPQAKDVDNLSAKDFAKRYGYGISTFIDPARLERSAVKLDPNAVRLAKMSAAERTAYLRALVGEKAANGDLSEPEKGAGGCAERAANRAVGDPSRVEAFSRRIAEMRAAISSNPKVLPEIAKWRSCVAERFGQRFENSQSMQRMIADRLSVIVAGIPADIDLESAKRLPVSAQRAIGSLQDQERSAALADLECFEKHSKELKRLTAELERQLVDEFQPFLEEVAQRARA